MSKRRKLKKKKRPKFRKFYKISMQDELLIEKEKLLQKIHTEIAKKVFKGFNYKTSGDWRIETSGVTLFIDPVFGNQAEISNTALLPLSRRLRLHIKLLRFLKKGYSILKAVEKCQKTQMKQLKD